MLSVSTAISPAELEARLRLHRMPDIGPKRFAKLLEAFGSASKAFSAPASAWRSLGCRRPVPKHGVVQRCATAPATQCAG